MTRGIERVFGHWGNTTSSVDSVAVGTVHVNDIDAAALWTAKPYVLMSVVFMDDGSPTAVVHQHNQDEKISFRSLQRGRITVNHMA